jgi:hypothetical protein
MTTADALELLWRRWYVVVLGLLLTAYAVQAVREPEPVYWTQAEVTLINPPAPDAPNELTTATKSLIAMAGLVVEDVQGRGTLPAVSNTVDLPGLGVKDGWEVRLPNAGGQWEPNFSRPVVDAQVVAGTPQEASDRLAHLVARVQRALDDRQAADGIAPRARIRGNVSLSHVRVAQLDGNRTRAAAMVLLLGMAGSAVGAHLVDLGVGRTRRLVSAARRRRRAKGLGSGPDRGAVLVPDVPAPHVPVG